MYNDFVYSLTKNGRRFKKQCDFVHEISERVIRERRQSLVSACVRLQTLSVVQSPAGKRLIGWPVPCCPGAGRTSPETLPGLPGHSADGQGLRGGPDPAGDPQRGGHLPL